MLKGIGENRHNDHMENLIVGIETLNKQMET